MITAEFSIFSAVWEAFSPIISLWWNKTSQCFSAIFMTYINVLVQNGLKNSTHSCRADVERFKVAITLRVLSWGQASRWVLECVCGDICTAVTSDSLQLSLSASPDIVIICESPTWPNPLLNSSQDLMFSRNSLVSNNHFFICFQVCVHYIFRH